MFMTDIIAEGVVRNFSPTYKSNLTPCERIELRNILYEQQEGCCDYCDRRCWIDRKTHNGGYGFPKELRSTLDHVIPVSQNGSDDISNLVMACQECNDVRGAMDAERFREIRQNETQWRKFKASRNYKALGVTLSDLHKAGYAGAMRYNTATQANRKPTYNQLHTMRLAYLWTLFPDFKEACFQTLSECYSY
jgi:CRISPR/Cas system Type II protein with McrA/HNH and RuvC-like nuclease domain